MQGGGVEWGVLCHVFASCGQLTQVNEEVFRSEDVSRSEDDLPVLAGFSDLISSPHLRVGHAAQDEHNHAGQVLALAGALVLVPVVADT